MYDPINYMIGTLEDLIEMADENRLPQTILDAIHFEADVHIAIEVGITWDEDELVFMFLCWEQIGCAKSTYLTREEVYPILLKDK